MCPDCIQTFEDALVVQQENPFMANAMTVLYTSGFPFSASGGVSFFLTNLGEIKKILFLPFMLALQGRKVNESLK